LTTSVCATAEARLTAADPHPQPLVRDRQQDRAGLGAEQRGDPLHPLLRRHFEHDPAVDFQSDRDMRRGQREATHDSLGVLRLDTRVLEEFPPRRRGEEQVADDDSRPRRAGGGRHGGNRPALNGDRAGVVVPMWVAAMRAGGDPQPGGGAD